MTLAMRNIHRIDVANIRAPKLVREHVVPLHYLLFVSNDNDFITQNGYQVGAPYSDRSGADVDTMLFVYRVTLPNFGK